MALGCALATWLDCPKLKLGGFVAIVFVANGFEASGFVIVDVATFVSEPKLKVLFSTLELT